MATNENKLKCEGCIHLGQFGQCWQGETPAECKSKMNIEQAIARLNDTPQRTTDAAGKYVDNALRRADPEIAGIMKGRSGFEAKGIEGYEMAWDGNPYGEARRFDADVLDGTIDPDYRGEVGCIVYSKELAPFIVKAGTRIAQMVFVRVALPEITEVNNVGAGGHDGFGSTGTTK